MLGKEFFVGLSEWTNEAGARAVAAAFPEYPCTPVKVKPDIPTITLGEICNSPPEVSVVLNTPDTCLHAEIYTIFYTLASLFTFYT